MPKKVYLYIFECASKEEKRSTQNISGDNNKEEIPVPMPNTEVKLYMPKILGGFLPGKIGIRQFLFYLKGLSNF